MAVNPVTPAKSVTSASRARGWATSTVWAGVLWVLIAILPIPGTTFLGIPFSLYALVGGFITAWVGGTAGDRSAVRRGRWGIGLGCLGYLYLLTFFTIAGGVLLAALIAAVRAAGNTTP